MIALTRSSSSFQGREDLLLKRHASASTGPGPDAILPFNFVLILDHLGHLVYDERADISRLAIVIWLSLCCSSGEGLRSFGGRVIDS